MNRVSTRAEFQPGLKAENFSPVKRAEKPHVIAFKFQPGLKYDLGHAHRLSCECETVSRNLFPPNFKRCPRPEIRHVIATKFQHRGRSEISARAEIRHVIGPLETSLFTRYSVSYRARNRPERCRGFRETHSTPGCARYSDFLRNCLPMKWYFCAV